MEYVMDGNLLVIQNMVTSFISLPAFLSFRRRKAFYFIEIVELKNQWLFYSSDL